MLAGDRIIVATEEGLTALELSTGRNLWSGNPVLSPWDVATDGENLYAVDYSLSPTEGLRIVQIDLDDGTIGDPLVDTKAYNGKLVRNQLLNVANGVAWLLTAPAPGKGAEPSGSTDPDGGWLIASFSLIDGKQRSELILREKTPEEYPWVTGARASGRYLVLFLRTDTGGVDVLVCDRDTGHLAWRDALPLSADDAARSPLAVDQDNLYVASKALSARRLSDGREVWNYQGMQATSYGPPALGNGVLYAVEGADTHALVAVSTKTGKLLWREKNPVKSGHEFKVAPTAGERYVYKHSAAGLHAIDLRTHESSWTHEESLDRFSAMTARGRLIGCGEGTLTALPLEDPVEPPTS